MLCILFHMTWHSYNILGHRSKFNFIYICVVNTVASSQTLIVLCFMILTLCTRIITFVAVHFLTKMSDALKIYIKESTIQFNTYMVIKFPGEYFFALMWFQLCICSDENRILVYKQIKLFSMENNMSMSD